MSRMQTDSIAYVLFDAGGTLLGTNTGHEHWYEQFFVEACEEQGTAVTLAQVDAALGRAVRRYDHALRCSTHEQVRRFWEIVYSGVFGELIPGCDEMYLARHYIERFESGEFIDLFADTLPALESLRARGIPLAVVSNFGEYLGHFLKRVGIAHYFNFVLISACEGCEKPHPEIFQRAIARTKLPPERIMFVGDHPHEDYEASERLGCRPVLIDRWDKHADKPALRRVRRLTEIAELL